MRTNKRLSILFIAVLVLSLTTSAFAANMDIHDIEANKVYKYDEFMADDDLFNSVLDLISAKPSKLLYEYDEEGYNFEDLNNNLLETGDLSKALEITEKEPLPTEDLEVVEVSAINSTQAEVKFNKAVKEVKPANFKVTDKDGNLVFVSQVTLNEAKDVATLTFVNKFADKATYTVEISNIADVDGNVMEKTTEAFTYVAAEVTKVEFTQTTVAPGTDLKTVVKVTDALGRDVTKEVNIEFESSNITLIPETGIVGNTEGSAIVVAKVKVGDNKWVKSARTTIKVADKTPTTFVGFNIYADDANPALTTDAFLKLDADKKVDFVYITDKGTDAKNLALYYKDQYSNSMNAIPNTDADVQITNLTPNIVIVEKDSSALKINPVFPGEGYVKVKVGEVENTIKIVVREESKITTMELDKTDISVVEDISDTVKITFKDQFGTKIDATPTEVKSSASTIATAQGVVNGVLITGVKEGTTTVEVSYKVDANTTLKQTINVTVTKAADLATYEVVVDATKLDINGYEANATDADKKDKLPKSTEVKVYEIDANGNKLGTATDVTLKEVDEDGKEIEEDKKLLTITDNKKVEPKEGATPGTAYVQVSVGSLVIDTLEFEIVNTASTATTVEFTRNDLAYTADYGDGAFSFELVGYQGDDKYTHNGLKKDLKTIIKVKDQYGKDMDMEDVSLTIDPLFTNLNGLKLDSTGVKLEDVTKATATLDIVVKEIKVGDDNLISEPVVIKVVVDAKEALEKAEKAAIKSLIDKANEYATINLEDKTITIKSEKENTELTAFVTKDNLNLAIAAGITKVKCGETPIDINNDTKVEEVEEQLGEKTLGDLAKKGSVTVTMGGETLELSVEVEEEAASGGEEK